MGVNPEQRAQNPASVPKLLMQVKEQARKRIVRDFCHIGYPIDKIGIAQFANRRIITVKESDLNCETDQVNMS